MLWVIYREFMGNLKEIRARISSTTNTKKITSAMKLVSAAKLRRAQHRITHMRPYALKMLQLIADIASTERLEHPLLKTKKNPKNCLLVVVSSDRGLCGGFNAQINKATQKFLSEEKDLYETLDIIFIGRKASDFFKIKNIEGKEVILNLAKEISYDMASKVSKKVMSSFKDGDYDQIKFIYNEFKSAIDQDVICETILPIDLSKQSFKEDFSFSKDMIFEPEPEKIIENLVSRHFDIQVYRILSESVASEHGARMNAMENATKNAQGMIQSLTLTYNKLRQAAITTELIEITSGAEALKG